MVAGSKRRRGMSWREKGAAVGHQNAAAMAEYPDHGIAADSAAIRVVSRESSNAILSDSPQE